MIASRERPQRVPLALLRVAARAEPVNSDYRLVTNDPRVVAAGQRGDVAGASFELSAVVHLDVEAAADVVLEVGRLAAVGACNRLDVIRPAPARLKDETA